MLMASYVHTGHSLRPVSDVHSLDEKSLLQYLKTIPKLIPVVCSKLRVLQFGHGQSNPTYLIQADEQKYVLRKKPPGTILKSAHAVEREFQVLSALHGSRVPVPRVHCLCSDPSVIGTPFYIMDYVEGRIFTDPSLPDLSEGERSQVYRQVAQTLAAIHSVDVDAVGLGMYGRAGAYCKRQVERWSQQYSASTSSSGSHGSRDPIMAEVMDWLKANVPREDAPSQGSGKGLVHGDYRLDNLVFHASECRVLAVLDWELSTLGNQMADVAYCCMPYNLQAGIKIIPGLQHASSLLPAGVPSQTQFLAMYCQASNADWPAHSWHFYLVLSLFKAAAIFAGVYQRAVQGNASSQDASSTASYAAMLASQALKVIHSGSTLPASPLTSDSAASHGFQPSSRAQRLRQRVQAFLQQHLYGREAELEAHAASDARWTVHPLVEELKETAKKGLWNL